MVYKNCSGFCLIEFVLLSFLQSNIFYMVQYKPYYVTWYIQHHWQVNFLKNISNITHDEEKMNLEI